jgi:hypothetical protein
MKSPSDNVFHRAESEIATAGNKTVAFSTTMTLTECDDTHSYQMQRFAD